MLPGHRRDRAQGTAASALKAMGDPLQTKTITLTCSRLLTGVTPWFEAVDGNLHAAQPVHAGDLLQAAFCVQSQWTIPHTNGQSPNEELIIKENIGARFRAGSGFAPNRRYSLRLNVNEDNPEMKVGEFIRFYSAGL
ncbi:MAG: hypothetical protein R3C44_10270 [Chloroflexota bacterium]